MNRNYKVIWNASLNCFMAVSEYAKARGKSSSGAVTSKASPTSSVGGGAKLLRLSALCAGIALTGVSVQSIAAINYQGDIGPNISALGTLNVKGGVSDATDLSDDNIGVISDSSPANIFGVKTLTIKLSKTLTGLESADFGGVKVSNTGMDANNTQITQLQSAGDITLASNALNAVNASDLTKAVAANKTHYYSVNDENIDGTTSPKANYNNDGATGRNSMAAGIGAKAEGNQATAVGFRAHAKASESTAIGRGTLAEGHRSVALGYAAKAIGAQSIALGEETETGSESYSVAIGTKSKALGGSSIAVGNQSEVSGKESIAIGKGSAVSGENSIAVGNGHTISGDNSGAFGDPNIVNGNNSYAVGNNNTIDADNSFVLGNNVTINASDKHSIALGEGAIINGEDSIAIGRNASAAAGTRNGLAIGVRSKSGNHAVSLGDDATSGNYAVALGSKSTASIGGTAIGQASSAVSNATALGRGAIAGQSGNVALGNHSITAAQHTGAFSINSLPVAGLTSGARTVSVGAVGAERQIQNVAPGVVDANSTDAINGSQLHATNSAIGDLGDTVDDGLNFVGDRGAVINRQLGDTLKITGGAAPTATLTNNNIGIRNDGSNGLIVELAEKVDLGANGSVKMGTSTPFGLGPVTTVNRLGMTTGNVLGSTAVTGLGVVVNGPFGIPSTTLTTNGLNIIGGPSVTRSGINASNKKIINVDKGDITATSTDGINGSQLFNNAQSIADNFGGGSIVNTDGTVSTPVYQINGNNQTGVAGAIAELDKGFNLETNGADTSTVKAGDTIDIGTATGETNIEVAKTGSDIKFRLADDIKLTSVETGNSLLNTNGLTIAGGPSFTASGINAGDQQITGVLSGGVLTDTSNELNAANIGDVRNAVGDITTLGFGIKAADGNTVQKNLGQAVEIVGSNNNIDTQVNGGKVEVALNNNLNLDANGSVKMGTSTPFGLGPVTTVNRLGMTTGNVLGSTAVTGLGVVVNGPFGVPSTTLTTNGLNIIGGPSVTRSGIDASNKIISNVKDGVAPKDGVNVSQLATSVAGSRTEVTNGTNVASVGKTTGGSGQDIYTVNADGASVSGGSTAVTVTPGIKNTATNVTDYQVDLSQTTKDSISDNTTNIIKGIKFNVNDTSSGGTLKKTFALGEEIKFDTDSNLTTTALSTGDGIKLALAPVVNVGATNPVQINGDTGEISGLTNRTFNPSTTYTGGVAATQEQLSDLNGKVTTLGFGIKAADGNNVQKNLGQAVEIVGSNNNIDTQVNGGKVEVMLNNNLDLDANGSVKMGTSAPFGLGPVTNVNRLGMTTGNVLGSTAVTGLGVVVNGPFGIPSTTLTTNGLNIIGGPSVTRSGIDADNKQIIKVASGLGSIDLGTATGSTLTNAANIGDLQNATGDLTDLGLNFLGDSGALVDRNLGDTLSIKGGETDTTKLAAGNNIGISTNTTGDGLLVQLAEDIDLGADGSVTTGNSVLDNNGLTITGGPTFTTTKVDAGGNQITNVTSAGDVTDTANKLNAVNAGDLTSAIAANKVKYFSVNSTLGGNENNDGATGADAIAIGKNAAASGDTSVALGFGAQANGDSSVVFGNAAGNGAFGDSNLIFGTGAGTFANGNNNVYNGFSAGSFANGNENIALGSAAGSAATGDNNIAIGASAGSFVNASQTLSIGQSATASANNAIAIGQGATASTLDAMAIGTNASTTTTGGVALGKNSVANIAGGATGFAPTSASTADQAAITATNSTNLGAISVGTGSAGGNRQIVNVAAGTNANDAVNVSQLTAVDNQVTTNTGNIGKGIKFNVNNGLKKTFALGEEIKFDTDSNLTTTALSTEDGIKLTLAPVVNIGATNPVQINGDTGTISGLTNTNFDASTEYTGGQAATQEQLSGLNTTLIKTGFNITADNSDLDDGETEDKVKLDETIDFTSTDGNIITTVSNNQIDFGLGSDISVGGAGVDGEDGVDGIIGVNGADGTSGVTINGKEGSIGLTGPSGLTGTITAIKGAPGLNGEDGITRIVIDDVQVATMEDGLNFAGNTGDTIAKKLNETLSIEGELADAADATGANLRVDSRDGKLNLVMARNLTELDSVAVGNSFLDTNGLAITDGPTFTTTKIDAAGNQITNLGSGLEVEGGTLADLAGAEGDTLNNAANIGDLQGAVTGITNTGFNITADNSNLDDDETEDNVKLGETVNFTNTDGNLVATVSDNGINYDLADDIQVTSLMAGNNTIVNNAGVTIVNGPKNTVTLSGSGLNNGDNRIINIAAGEVSTASKDAINGSQLNATADSIKNVIGGNATNVDGVITTTNIGDTGKDTINEAIKAVNTTATQAKSTVTKGDNIVVTSTTNEDGSTNYQVETTKDLTVDSVTTNGGQLDNDGLTVGDVTIDKNKGIDAGGTVIAGVGAGKANTDAVNVGQLNSVVTGANKGFNISAQRASASNISNGGSVDFSSKNDNIIVSRAADSSDMSFELNRNLDLGATGSVKTGNTIVNNDGVTIQDGPSMTSNGINAGDKVITGVADGIEVTDAVNLGQLNTMDSRLRNGVNNLGYKIDDLGSKIDDVEDDANAGISAAMAMSSLPQAYTPGKSMIGGGIATYNGESAVAIGISRVSDNGRWVIKANGTADTQGNAGGAIGAGFQF